MPSIVVTYDEQRRMPSRPPRRSESLRIRPSNSTPDFSNEVEEAAAAAAAKILQERRQIVDGTAGSSHQSQYRVTR